MIIQSVLHRQRALTQDRTKHSSRISSGMFGSDTFCMAQHHAYYYCTYIFFFFFFFLHTNNNNGGCGKRGAHIKWSMVMIPEKEAPVIVIALRTSSSVVLCRRTLSNERHRRATAWPDKLGTDPMAVGSIISKWTSPRKSGGIP